MTPTKELGIYHSSHLSLEIQNQTDYIPKDIQDLSQLGYVKKERAKKAIRSLLSLVPHTIEEIADHFEISPELVKGLITELTKAKLVVNAPNHSSKRYLKSKKFDGAVIHELMG